MSSSSNTYLSGIDLAGETESPLGWSYDARIHWASGSVDECSVRLSSADYELWSAGLEAPSAVAERGLRIAAETLGSLPASLDLATMRRRIQGYDDRMRGR